MHGGKGKDGQCGGMVSSRNEPVDGGERNSGWCEDVVSSWN